MPAEDKERKPADREKEKPEGEAVEKIAKPKAASPLVKKLILAGVVLAIIVVEAIVAYMIVKATRQEDPRVMAEKQAKESEEASRLKQTTMGTTTAPISVVVNVGGEMTTGSKDEERYAKVSIQLEYEEEGGGGGGGEKEGEGGVLTKLLESRIPKIKNILIETLTSMKYEELITPAGKMKLRQTVLREVNKTLPPKAGLVRDVFLSEFVVQ